LAEDNWQKVKDRIRQDRTLLEREFGLKTKGTKGEWTLCACPLHSDQDESASLSATGGLRCHVGCTEDHGKDGMDVFQWVAKLQGIKEHEALDLLGRLYQVDTTLHRIPPRTSGKARMPDASEAMVEECCKALVVSTHPRARFYRRFLLQRGLEPALVAQNDVGFHEREQRLVFFQRTGDGTLRPFWRFYDWFGKEKGEWRWGGNRGAMKDNGPMNGLWPLNHVEAIQPGQRVWIVEGEWDALTARCRLQWQEAKNPIHVLSVTGGKAGLRLPAGHIPDVLKQTRVTLCFDNDVFQNPDPEQIKAPDAKSRQLIEVAQESFLRDALEFWRKVEGKPGDEPFEMWIGAVPLPGDTKPKADLRDWCDVGGCDPADWKTWDFEALRPDMTHPVETTFDEAGKHINELVCFDGTVDALITDNVIVPRLSELVCDAGSHPYCANCVAFRKFSDTNFIVPWTDDQMFAYAMKDGKDRERFERDDVLGRPRACQQADLVPKEFITARRWAVGPRQQLSSIEITENDRDQRARKEKSLVVVSYDDPPMSGVCRVTGTVVEVKESGTKENVAVLATRVESVQRSTIKFEDYYHDIRAVVGNSKNVDDFDAWISDLAQDVSANITGIYQQDEMHIGIMLTFCSALRLPNPDGKRPIRGWIDSIYFGDTGAAKTPVATTIGELMGAAYHSSPGNTSRAGFVLGTLHDPSLGGYVTKLGTLVKQHGGGLVVDEAQLLGIDVFDACQTARTDGVVKSGKAGGNDRVYPCAVRIAWLANWIKGQRDNYRYACEHIAQLCGMKDESVRRFDFGLAVPSKPEWEPYEFAHKMTPELLRALAVRAQAMSHQDVVIEEGGWKLARQLVLGLAPDCWPVEVPLLVPAEKDKSLMRIAVAAANLACSHPEDNIHKVLVTKAHIEWAKRWLVRSFKSIEYDRFSQSRMRAEKVACPYLAELHLCVELAGLNAETPEIVRGKLDALDSHFTMSELETLFSDPIRARGWLAMARSLNVVNKSRRLHPNRTSATMRLSGDAQAIRNAWCSLLDERGVIPVKHRSSVLRAWRAAAPNRRPGEGNLPNLEPLVDRTSLEVLEDVYPDREEDIGQAEPMH